MTKEGCDHRKCRCRRPPEIVPTSQNQPFSVNRDASTRLHRGNSPWHCSILKVLGRGGTVHSRQSCSGYYRRSSRFGTGCPTMPGNCAPHSRHHRPRRRGPAINAADDAFERATSRVPPKPPSRLLSEVREIGVTFNPGAATVRPGEMFARARYGSGLVLRRAHRRQRCRAPALVPIIS
jgi:hypothetical protein